MPSVIQAIFIGIFEISNGINRVALLNINLSYKMCIASFILSFSSLMILVQIYSFVSKTKVKFREILKYKLLQGVFSFIITYITVTYIYLPVTAVNANLDNLNKITLLFPYAFYIATLVITLCIILILFGKKRQD